MRGAIAAVALVALAGCPTSSGSAGSRQRPVAACAKAGDSCEVTPGKIGLCTQKNDSCEGPSCLTCMPLH